MASLKEIRVRIASVQSTQKITSAMKLVSAAKLRRAQNAILSLRPYSNKLNEILANLSTDRETIADNVFYQDKSATKVALVVITSNRGLCGSLNSNVVKEVTNLLATKYKKELENNEVDLYCIGKKGSEVLRRKNNVVFEDEEMLNTSSFTDLSELANTLLNAFRNNEIGRVEIVYHKFLNPATQHLVVENWLPIQNNKVETAKTSQAIDYIMEPSKEELLEELVPKGLRLQLYKTLLDSIASEHGARMTSMSKATDNASEILKDLKLKYNNARQAAITNELNEIVSGAEALNG